MKKILWLFAIAAPSVAAALPPFSGPADVPGAPALLYTPDTSISSPNAAPANHETPTMRRQKLTRALALREEAARLLEADGGTLTPEHQAYVQRKGRAILNAHRP